MLRLSAQRFFKMIRNDLSMAGQLITLEAHQADFSI